jgi:hypothetical protein
VTWVANLLIGVAKGTVSALDMREDMANQRRILDASDDARATSAIWAQSSLLDR